MTRPKYSVLIPTRERAVTLEHALRTLTSQNHDCLEIVVSDNCSRDHTREVVGAAMDPRIRYVRTRERVSMSHNWEFGLSKCNGDFVSVIGDDDGFLPGAFHALDALLSEYPAEAVISRHCSYIWPSQDLPNGLIAVPLGMGVRWATTAEVRNCVLSGLTPYTELPLLYNGTFVSRRAIDRVRDQYGSFFGSCIPDVYSGIALSCVIERHIFSERPLAINGASKFSTGSSYFANSERSKAANSPASAFASEQNLPFHPSVPVTMDGRYPPSIVALVLESYLKSKERFPSLAEPDLEYQNALILAQGGRHIEELREWSRRFREVNQLRSGSLALKWAPRLSAAKASQVMRRIRAVVGTYVSRTDAKRIPNVYEASLAAHQVRENPPKKLAVALQKVASKSKKLVETYAHR